MRRFDTRVQYIRIYAKSLIEIVMKIYREVCDHAQVREEEEGKEREKALRRLV